MTRRTKMMARTFISVAGAATVAALLPGCPEQPEQQCTLARGPFSARYTVLERSGTCEGVPETVGEIVGVEQYFEEKSGRKPDYTKPSVALQADTMGTLAQATAGAYGVQDENPDHKLYALGTLNSFDPAGSFCTVGSLSAAQLELPFIEARLPDGGIAPDSGTPDGGDPDPGDAGADVSAIDEDGGADAAPEAAAQEEQEEGLPAQAAVSLRYDWSNVRFLVKPEIPGQAFDADLTVTQNGCVTKYRVNAISYPKYWQPGPASLCAPVIDDAGTLGEADDTLCNTYANPSKGVAVGSQINPRFRTRCEPATNYCVLADEVANYQ